jgi:hypothetical protein
VFCWILIIIYPLNLHSQAADSTDIASTDSTGKKSLLSLYGGTGAGTNFVYLGSTISRDLPYAYASAIVGIGEQLYLSVNGVYLSNLKPVPAFWSVSLNYSKTFNSWFDISAGVTRYQVASELSDTLFNSFNYGDLTLGLDWKLLYTKVSAGLLQMDNLMGFLQVRNSRYFHTKEFSAKKLFISFDPYINYLAGPVTEYMTTQGEPIIIPHPVKPEKDRVIPGEVSTTSSTSFRSMEIDFGIPVALNGEKFTFETEAEYIYPLISDRSYQGTKGFLLTFSLIFKIL